MAEDEVIGREGSADSTALLRVFDGLADGVCVSGDDGRILYMNPAAERILGARPPESRRMSLCDLLCGKLSTTEGPEAKTGCPLREPASRAEAITYRGRHSRGLSYGWRDSDVRRIEKSHQLRVRCMRAAVPLLDIPDREQHVTIIEDVRAERDLERRKEDWRNMVAHDLRTPLSVVQASLLELEDVGLAKDASSAKLLELAIRNGRKMGELLDLYLDLAKLDAGLMPVRPARLELAPLAKATVDEQSALAERRRIQVSVEVPASLAATADESLTERIVRNILNNALIYAPEGGHVRVLGAGDAAWATLSIEDDGPGIAEEDVPRIFDRYYQSEARRQGKLKGTGLGLAFCREAIKAMRGSISVRSRPGTGSVFEVRLPAASEVDLLDEEI